MEDGSPHSRLTGLLRRHGVIKVTLAATLLSIALSVLITLLISALLKGRVQRELFIISIAAPTLIAPLLSYFNFRMVASLDQAEQRLKVLSTTDELTGAFNRRSFLELARYELDRCESMGGELSIAIMDFDQFKQINDRYGHLAGDQALREVSRICRESIRKADIFARYGGDEFIFLLPQTDLEAARECLQRVIDRVAALTFESEAGTVNPHVSIGVHSFGPKSRSLDAILQKADLALYKAKHMGGSRVAW